MNVFDLSAKITMDINGYLKNMESAKGVAVSTLSVIGGAAQGFFKDSVETGKQFGSSMSQVAATLGVTTDEVGNLSEFAQEMGRTTAFSATQAADALNYMALAGYDTETSMETLPTVLDLAAAGGMDLARASDMVTDTQTAFGMSLKRTKKMVNEMAKAASTGNTSVEQLGDAFLVVGGLAKELNGGMVELKDGTTANVDGVQELEIALTAMANAGVKGSEAGTHMRNMLMKLSSPTAEGVKQMEALGVQVFDTDGKMRSLKDIFGDLNTSMSNLTQEEKLQAIADLFNARDTASAEALLAAVGEDWDHIGEAILDADGAAKQMAETQLDNLAGDTKLLESAVEGAQIALSEALDPALRNVTQLETEFVTAFTEGFKSLPGEVQTVIAVIGDIGTKIVEVLPQITGMISTFAQLSIMKSLSGDAGKLKTSLKNVGGIAAGVATAIGGVAIVLEQVHEESKKISKDYDELKFSTEVAVDSSKSYADEVAELIESLDQYSTAEEKRLALNEKIAEGEELRKEAGKQYWQTTQDMTNGTKLLTDAETTRLSGLGGLMNTMSQYGMALNPLWNGLRQTAIETAETSQQQDFANRVFSMGMTQIWGVHDASEALIDGNINTEESIKGLNESMNSLYGALVYVKDETEQVDGAMEALEPTVTVAGQNIAQSTWDSFQTVVQACTDMSTALQNVGGSVDTWFSQVEERTALNGEVMRQNWEAQQQDIIQWENNLAWLLDNGLDTNLVQVLAEKGTAGAAEVSAIMADMQSNGEAGISEMATKWNELMASQTAISNGLNPEADNVVKKIGEIKAGGSEALQNMAQQFSLDASGVGADFTTGFVGGAIDLINEVGEAGAQVGSAMLDGTMTELDSHSPSREAETIGINFDAGLNSGMQNGERLVTMTAAKLGTAMTSGVSQGIAQGNMSVTQAMAQLNVTLSSAISNMVMSANAYSSQFGTIGYNLSIGLANGIYRGDSVVSNAMAWVVRNALYAAQRAADSHSPSRETMWLGETLGQGLAVGIKNSTSEAEEAAKGFVSAVNGTIESGLNSDYSIGTEGYQTVPATEQGTTPANITLNIYGAEGQDIEDLADIIMRRMNRAIERQEAAYA